MADFLGGLSARAEEMKGEEPAALRQRIAERRGQQAVEYRVDVVREKLVGDALSEDYVQLVLNDRAADGWSLGWAVETQVTSLVTRGGSVSGLMLIFQRPGPAA